MTNKIYTINMPKVGDIYIGFQFMGVNILKRIHFNKLRNRCKIFITMNIKLWDIYTIIRRDDNTLTRLTAYFTFLKTCIRNRNVFEYESIWCHIWNFFRSWYAFSYLSFDAMIYISLQWFFKLWLRWMPLFVTSISSYLDISHDDVIKWKHFPRYWPFVWGIHRSPVNSPHKGQWYTTFVFSLICAWINGWETIARPVI